MPLTDFTRTMFHCCGYWLRLWQKPFNTFRIRCAKFPDWVQQSLCKNLRVYTGFEEPRSRHFLGWQTDNCTDQLQAALINVTFCDLLPTPFLNRCSPHCNRLEIFMKWQHRLVSFIRLVKFPENTLQTKIPVFL